MSMTGNLTSAMLKKKPIKWRAVFKSIGRHGLLTILAGFWLIPIAWLVANSFSGKTGVDVVNFFPKELTLNNYVNLLFSPDTVSQFPVWFKNTLIIAIFTCIISSIMVLMIAYAISCMRFRARKPLMNFAVVLNLFPGFLSMIAVYFIMKSFDLTNSHIGLILVYSGSSGLGYLIAKGFFDTVPITIREAAKIEGASEMMVFLKIVIPLSKPIIVYTVISSFLGPWMDFIFARIMLNSGIATDWTVAIGLYAMLDRSRLPVYFTQFCAGGVLVSIPISILFIIMQKFYVEGITGGAVKG